MKIGDEKPQVERRVQATEVGDDVHYHMDQFFGEEEFLAWDEEAEEVTVAGVPEALWSSAPLDRVPADPQPWIDELADEVEEQRLLKTSVLETMEGEKTGFKKLTTRFVRDWRVKPRQDLPGALESMQWTEEMMFTVRQLEGLRMRRLLVSGANGCFLCNQRASG